MSVFDPNPNGVDRSRAEAPGRGAPAHDDDRHERAARSWRPGVRLVLALVVLVPLVSTGILIVSSASSAWATRVHAAVAAQDAEELEVVASARAQMNSIEVPLSAVSYAAQLGVSESELDALLQQKVPFHVQLAQGTKQIDGFPTFRSTPTLRADTKTLGTLINEVANKAVSFDVVQRFLNKMATDIDAIWYRDYANLQSAISQWQPPGSFEVNAAALRQAYAAFLAGGAEIQGAIFVLEGLGPANSKEALIQAAGEFGTATAQFAGHLSGTASRAWVHLTTDPVDRAFAATVQLGVNTALNGTKPPFLGNLAFAGKSMTPGLQYLLDLNKLVTSASNDLRSAALAQSKAATGRFVLEVSFLGVLALVCLGSVVFAGRVLIRPLERLAAGATRIHHGDFDLERLPPGGPRQVEDTTEAFNDMASTLKAVEAKAVALAAEDLSHPELLVPLPGRTGRALQASVDTLAARIRERELQRALLHEAATHDGLTGLLNRAAVLDYLTNDVSRRREAGETVAVLFIDLDGLKPLNDTYGHEVGDTAILATAMALATATGDCDVVGRLGGDEFLVVLCHDHSCDGDTVVDSIRERVAQCRIPVDGALVPLEASVGVALTRCDADTDPMVLVRQADEAMYEAKKAARLRRDQMLSANS
ncbi:MAG TPA: diguanylate cyclase [Acidimicrobiales bacterium]|nr:diguanylate cyclase [Acidimicrobiales bacterium]